MHVMRFMLIRKRIGEDSEDSENIFYYRFELLAVEEKNKKLVDEMKELHQEKELYVKTFAFAQRENELILEDLKMLQNEKAEKAEKAIDLE